MHKQHHNTAVGLVMVGFSPADRLAALARHLGWPGQVLSDPARAVYSALDLRRAPLWRVYAPRTLLIYARAVRRGDNLPRPVEDTRQLGGDAILLDGTVVQLWRPRTPDDRPLAAEVLAAADEVLRRR